MTFPIAHTVTRKPYQGDTCDGLGNTIPGGYDPAETVGVYAIAPHTAEFGSDTITETQVVDVDVFMPKSAVSLKDLFVIDGDDYETVAVRDWTKGFHGWEPGIVVELRRVA